LLALAACPGGPTARQTIAAELDRTARDHGPRAALEEAAERVESALAAGDGERARRVLGTAWPLSTALADDRVPRELLGRLDEAMVPKALVAARAVERAQRALEDGRRELAYAVLERATPPGRDDLRVALRWHVAHLLAAPERAAALARTRLSRLANTSVPAGDAVTRELASLARLSLAASWLDEGDLKEAISGFLRVEQTSGYWRQARFGLATCQLRAGRPESALKILALLPGGFVAEPERALMSAAAAHAIGQPESAVAIVDAALARRALWQQTPESHAAVEVEAARLAAGGRLPEDDTLITVTAATPSVRAALAEVAATRAARAAATGPAVATLGRWGRRVERVAREVVTRELAARAKVAAERFADLETLRPQLE